MTINTISLSAHIIHKKSKNNRKIKDVAKRLIVLIECVILLCGNENWPSNLGRNKVLPLQGLAPSFPPHRLLPHPITNSSPASLFPWQGRQSRPLRSWDENEWILQSVRTGFYTPREGGVGLVTGWSYLFLPSGLPPASMFVIFYFSAAQRKSERGSPQ